MGLDLGIDSVGRFNILACLEYNKNACQTIRLNQGRGKISKSLKIYEGDIRDFDPIEIMSQLGLKKGELDLLIGGPPCQAFSTAGKRQSVDDPRGTLLWQYLKFVEIFEPKTFIMENVRGLMSASLKPLSAKARKLIPKHELTEDQKKGSVVKLFMEDLFKISNGSYRADVFEVNSVNYGAPQIRERAIFMGNRLGKIIEFPSPTHVQNPDASESQISLFDTKKMKRWATLFDAIGDLKEEKLELLNFSPRKIEVLSQVPEGGNWRSLPEDVQRDTMGKAFLAKGGRSGWWRRLTFDLPCPTVITMPNHASTSLCHPIETRVLSVKEYSRIQEFPDDWEFAGSTSEKYKQIGNAVPVRLGAVAGKVIVDLLDNLKESDATRFDGEYRIVYLQSHIRTRKWFDGNKAVLWDKNNTESDYSPPKTKIKTKTLN